MAQTYLAPGVKSQMRKHVARAKKGAAAAPAAAKGGSYGLASVPHKGAGKRKNIKD